MFWHMYILAALVACLFVASTNAYTLVDHFSGATFFDKWDFFTDADPTHGVVEYVDFATAAANKYIGLVDSAQHNNLVYIGANFQDVVPTARQSVRISSKTSYTHGLVLVDVLHMPDGCANWGAIWAVSASQTWPNGGEIDLIESVNGATQNSMTLHTTAGCVVDNSTTAFSGTLQTADCWVSDPSQPTNQGCSILAPPLSTYTTAQGSCTHATAGKDFNANHGGMYALLWTADEISVWFFPRDYIPADIRAGAPDPDNWIQHTKPLAQFVGCDFAKHVSDLALVIDTDFCGDWAGNVWTDGGCAARTGVGSCQQFVRENPGAFVDAYWLLGAVSVYQNLTGTEGAVARRGTGSGEGSSRAVALPVVDLSARRADAEKK